MPYAQHVEKTQALLWGPGGNFWQTKQSWLGCPHKFVWLALFKVGDKYYTTEQIQLQRHTHTIVIIVIIIMFEGILQINAKNICVCKWMIKCYCRAGVAVTVCLFVCLSFSSLLLNSCGCCRQVHMHTP